MSKRVLVVSPPYEFRSGPGPYSRVADPATGALVTFLREHDIAAHGYLAAGTGPSAIPRLLEHVLALIRDHDIHLLGISTNYMPNIPSARALIEVVRRNHPHVLIAAGGSIVTGLIRAGEHEAFLPGCDVFVPGDGEMAMLRLAADEQQTFVGRKPVLVAQEDTPSELLSSVSFEGVYFGSERHARVQLMDESCRTEPFFYEAISTRACPCHCTFCISQYMGSFRESSPSALRATVNDIKGRGATRFNFDNCHFNLPRVGFAERMAVLADSRLAFNAQARLGLCRREEIAAFAAAGGKMLYFGLETLAKEVQGLLDKKAPLEAVNSEFRMCHEEGVSVGVNIIVGLPGSTEDRDVETISKVIEMREKGYADVISAGVFVPHPGTRFWRNHDLPVVDEDPWHWDNDSAVVTPVDPVTGYRYTKDAVERVYRSIPQPEYNYCAP